MPARETVMSALFTQVITAGSVFATYSRLWLPWMDDPQATRPQLPLLVLWEPVAAESYVYSGRGMPPKRVWDVILMVYAKRPDGETPGVPDATTPSATVINPLMDALETALAPSGPDGVLTLGGLVIDCRIEGNPLKAYGGDVDPSGICSLIVPLKILIQ